MSRVILVVAGLLRAGNLIQAGIPCAVPQRVDGGAVESGLRGIHFPEGHFGQRHGGLGRARGAAHRPRRTPGDNQPACQHRVQTKQPGQQEALLNA